MKRSQHSFIFLVFATLLSSCLSPISVHQTRIEIPKIAQLETLFATSISNPEKQHLKSQLETELKTQYDRLRSDPGNFESLSRLARIYMLFGDAFAARTKDKKQSFLKAIEFSERAMLTNSEFRQLVENGEPIWEASRVLGLREIDAMMAWTNSVFYYFKDVLGTPGKILNAKWLNRATNMLDRMSEIDPQYLGGSIDSTWAIFYLALPEVAGGDLEKSRRLFDQAVENSGETYLFARWARAKYFHVRMRNPEGFKEDLQWVSERNLEQCLSDPLWNQFFQINARELLDSEVP